jgi:uncharacterized protein
MLGKDLKKRVLVVHGWGGSPNEPMLQWLKTKVEEGGMEVVLPKMPNTENPVIEDWIRKLEEVVGDPDRNTILVGHSVGCQAILRYIEKLHPIKRVGGVVFIAPWFTLTNLESDEEWEIIKPWLETSIKDANIIKHIPKMTAIFSDNDPFVPTENKEFFERRFGSEIITEHQKGHFTEEDGVIILQSALDAILELKDK